MPWDPGRLGRSDQLRIVYFVAAPRAGATLADIALIQGGWSFARHIFTNTYLAYSAGQSPSDNPQFIWNAPVDELDLITLKSPLNPAALLEDMYAEGVKRASSDGLYRLLEAMFELSSDKKATEIDWLMTNAQPERLAPEYSVGMLRSTANDFAWLDSWTLLRDRVAGDLKRRGLDPSQILIGLF
jgi:hypothetical protein